MGQLVHTVVKFAYTIVAPQSLHAGDLFDSDVAHDGNGAAAFGVVV